jgi:predicted MFS family arabinose efflux permease
VLPLADGRRPVEFRHFTLLKAGLFASLPLFAGVVGDTVGGLATDWLLKKTGNIKLARRSVAIVGMLGCCGFIVPAALTTDASSAVFCLTGAMFFLECTIGPSWAVPMDAGGKYSGTVSGMMNKAGNIGGALSPLVFGFLVQYGNWEAPFIVAAALPLPRLIEPHFSRLFAQPLSHDLGVQKTLPNSALAGSTISALSEIASAVSRH